MKKEKSLLYLAVLLLFILFGSDFVLAVDTIIYEETFEGATINWSAENGVWEVGAPTSGPGECHGGTNCAATVLTGTYENDTDSRLVGPCRSGWDQGVELPEIDSSEEIYLRFWHWFNYYPYNVSSSTDWGQVQISVYNETGGWSTWADVGTSIQDESSGWSQKAVELTEYAGQKVKVAFYHSSDEQDTRVGWYIDDVQIIKTEPTFDGTFEDGWGGWYADRGVWQLGEGDGPDGLTTHLFSTMFDEAYPNYTDSRLVSPTVTLSSLSTDNEEIHLRFWHWFNYYPYNVSSSTDWGQVQISVYNETGGWSTWADVGTSIQDESKGWSQKAVDLTEYAGQKVRVAFYHSSDEQDTRVGWYIDDVQIIKTEPTFDGTFEDGWGGWYADRGVWQLGEGDGPDGLTTHLFSTMFDEAYPNYTDSRLVSPTVTLSSLSTDNEEIHLRFWHWFNYYPYNVSSSTDWSQVQISVYDETSGWSTWEDVGTSIQDESKGWSQKAVDLTEYAGQTVRVAFYHSSDEQDTRVGWYIDDVTISQDTPKFTGDFEMGWMDWHADRGVWQIGTPTSGPAECFSGDRCAGTIIDSTYPSYTDSRLVSATIDLSSTSLSIVYLSFREWFSYSDDYGEVQISVWDSGEGQWLDWQSLDVYSSDTSKIWTQKYIDLSSYSGMIFRIGFLHNANSSSQSYGWFIDNIEIVGPDQIMPIVESVSYTRYIPDPCTSLIDVVAEEPFGGDLGYLWQLVDGGTLAGEGANVEFVPPEIRVEPYTLRMAAFSKVTNIATFTEVLTIFTEVLHDYNYDGDIDGSDLQYFTGVFSSDEVERFAKEFGLIACE